MTHQEPFQELHHDIGCVCVCGGVCVFGSALQGCTVQRYLRYGKGVGLSNFQKKHYVILEWHLSLFSKEYSL